MRPGGDAVVDGGSQELFEAVGGKEIEEGLLGIANQQALLLQGAGDTQCDGVQQAHEFVVIRCLDAVEAWALVIEGVNAVVDEGVEVNVEVQSTAEPLNQRDSRGASTGIDTEAGTLCDECRDRAIDG